MTGFDHGDMSKCDTDRSWKSTCAPGSSSLVAGNFRGVCEQARASLPGWWSLTTPRPPGGVSAGGARPPDSPRSSVRPLSAPPPQEAPLLPQAQPSGPGCGAAHREPGASAQPRRVYCPRPRDGRQELKLMAPTSSGRLAVSCPLLTARSLPGTLRGQQPPPNIPSTISSPFPGFRHPQAASCSSSPRHCQ